MEYKQVDHINYVNECARLGWRLHSVVPVTWGLVYILSRNIAPQNLYMTTDGPMWLSPDNYEQLTDDNLNRSS